MNKDFHLYATFLAARDAGYNIPQAKQIAFAAQMVDDFSENYSKICHTVTEMFSKLTSAFLKNIFNKYEDCFDISDTWMAFHFIPKQKYDPLKITFENFICGYGDPIKNICENIPHGNPNDSEYLTRIGITMHVLADSFAHQEFCGVTCKNPNVIANIEVFMGRNCLHLETGDHVPVSLSDYISGVFYFGHGSAAHVPDLSWLKYYYNWKKEPDNTYLRDNPQLFTNAYEAMLGILTRLKFGKINPNSINNIKKELLSKSNQNQIKYSNIIDRNKAIQNARCTLADLPVFFSEEESKVTYPQLTIDGDLIEIESDITKLYNESVQKIELDENIDRVFEDYFKSKHPEISNLNAEYESYLAVKDNWIVFEKAAKAHKDAVYRELGIDANTMQQIVHQEFVTLFTK